MKKYIIQTICQWYADLICKCIQINITHPIVDYWIQQGQWLDAYCVEIHDIYLK